MADGWINMNVPMTYAPLSFAEYGGELIVAVHNKDGLHPNPIFRLASGTTWKPLGHLSPRLGAFLPNHMITGPNGELYVAFGGLPGTSALLRYDGTWTKVAGDGLYGSWMSSIDPLPTEWVYRTISFHDKIYAGLATSAGTWGHMWEMTPPARIWQLLSKYTPRIF